jgi:hypothetical protein
VAAWRAMTFQEEVARRNGCANKRTYFSKKIAQTVANARSRGFRRGDSPGHRVHAADRELRVYQCDFCNYWHLTSSEERR